MASRIAAQSITTGNTATLLAAADTRRTLLSIYNDGGADIFVGPSGVTAAEGFIIGVNSSMTLQKTDHDSSCCEAWYAIAAVAQTPPADTRVLEGFAL
jgi:hypothetical protein